MSEEQKRRISESERGKFVSEETRRKISLNQTGRSISEEQKKKISLAHKKRIIPESQINHIRKLGLASKGRVLSEDVRRKVSLSVSAGYLAERMRRKNNNLRYNGNFFRSSWEVKFAKWLDENGFSWEYEKHRYICKNGRVYIPDFLVNGVGFVEVKGFLSKQDALKMNEFVLAGNKLFIIDLSNINSISLNKEYLVSVIS